MVHFCSAPLAQHPNALDKRPSLIVQGGPQDGANIPIRKPAITMGCLPDSDIVIDGPRVSRRHAEIVRLDAGFHIWDLGITNGTFVNHNHIGETTYSLQHGDQIRLADSNIFHIFSNAEAFFSSVALPRSIEETLNGISGIQKPPGIIGIDANYGQTLDGWNGVQEKLAPPCDDAVYEGNVKLRVAWDGGVRLLIGFVTILRTTPQVRVVRLVGNSRTDVEIWLALREPLRLEQMLAEIEGVSQFTELSQEGDGPDAPKRVLDVKLSRECSQVIPPSTERPGTRL